MRDFACTKTRFGPSAAEGQKTPPHPLFARRLISKLPPSGSAPAPAARRPGGGELTSGARESSTPEQTKLAQRLIDEGQSVREIADTFNVHSATIYRLSQTAA